MKRWLKYILISMFLFVGMDGVEAKLTTCYYENTMASGVTMKYTCSVSSTKNTLECDFSSSGTGNDCQMIAGQYVCTQKDVNKSDLDNDLNVDDFISNGEVTCLDKIYIEIVTLTSTYSTTHSIHKIDDYEFEKTQSEDDFLTGIVEFLGTYNDTVVKFPLKGDPVVEEEEGETDDSTEEDYLDECSELGQTLTLIKQIYNLFKYLIPVLVIGLSIIDFLKVIVNGEEKVFNEAWTKFIKRVIVGIVIFIIPFVLSLLLDMSGVLDSYGIDNSMKSIFCIFE